MENSPFLRLAPELRNRIYQLSFQHLSLREHCTTLDSVSKETALTRTCREIRTETHAMFYATAEIVGHLGHVGHGSAHFSALLQTLGPDILCQLWSLSFDFQECFWRTKHLLCVQLVGQGQRSKVPAAFFENDLPSLNDWFAEICECRETVLTTLTGMGLDVEVALEDDDFNPVAGEGDQTRKDIWIVAKPTLGSPEASSEPA